MGEAGFFQHGPVTLGVRSENTAFVQLAIEFFWFMLGRFQLEWQPGTKNPTRRANARNAAPVCYSSLGADLSATPENTNDGGVLRAQEKAHTIPADILLRVPIMSCLLCVQAHNLPLGRLAVTAAAVLWMISGRVQHTVRHGVAGGGYEEQLHPKHP